MEHPSMAKDAAPALDRRTLRELRRPFWRQFFRNNKFNLFMTLVASVLSSAANIGISMVLQLVFDVISGDTALTLTEVLLISVGAIAVLLIGGAIDYFFLPRFRTRALMQYKEYVFGELTRKGVQAFASENTTVYISALSNDIAAIEQNTIVNIQSAVELTLTFIGALGLMLINSPLLTLIAIGFSIMPIIVSLVFGNRLAVEEKNVSDAQASYLGVIKDALTGFAVIKSFKAERAIKRVHEAKNGEVSAAKIKHGKVRVLIAYVSSIANVITQFGVFLISAALALAGMGVTTGMVVLFVQLMNYLLNPIMQLPQYAAGLKASNALIDKLAAALNSNSEDGGIDLPPTLREGIALRGVSFAYEEGKPVLKGVDMEFRAGGCYAVVGGSGSGKSTVLNLLMAAYRGYEGSITYDGCELRDITAGSLYDLVSMIQQNVFVFNSTIRENITMFSDFPEDEIDRAVRLSGLEALIRERGEDYLCGENGSGLSGGERQTISIARALLRKTPVLFVDEATASLDAETSFGVLRAILDLEDYTRVIVTHDLDETVLSRCDGIVALKNGRVAESGNFARLMESKGYFYSLFTVSQEE